MQGEFSKSKNVASRARGWLNRMAFVLAMGLGLCAGIGAQDAHAEQAAPVFRFYNTNTGTHFYTIEVAERDNIIRLYPSFAYEGVAFYAFKNQVTGSQPVFRFYNRSTNTHFYTISQSDKDYVLQNYPVFNYEGSAYYAMVSPVSGSQDLYRFYNRMTGAHFYTTSATDRDYVKATWPWFAYEGIAYQVFADAIDIGSGGGGGGGPAASTTAVVSSANPAAVGSAVTFIATVNGTAPSGTVSFTDNGAAIANCTSIALAVSGNTGSAACSTSTLAAGSHTIVASYGGNAANAASSGSLAQVMSGGGGAVVTTTTVSSSTNPSIVGNSVTFTASVAGSTPTGTVTFTDGGAAIGCNAVPLTGFSNASCTTSALALGSHSIMASYSGDAGNMASSGTLTQVVNASGGGGPGSTTTMLSSSMNPQAAGAAVVFTATVNGNAPTGSVGFTANGTAINNCAVVNFAAGTGNSRIAQCSTTTLAVGTIAIVAKYSGDANNAASTSATLNQTITGAAAALVPRVAFSLSNTLVVAPQAVTITATATETGGTIARVSLYLNGAKLADLTASPYTFTTTALPAGTHAIYATATDLLGTTVSTLTQNVVAISGPPPVVTTDANVWRLLNQATFGASQMEAARVLSMGVSNWIDNQFLQPVSGYPDTKYNVISLKSIPSVCTTQDPAGKAYPADSPQAICARDHLSLAMIQRDFFINAITAPDQLRQRVAFALSQILVTSGNEQDLSFAYVMSRYQSIMFNNAFGNFRTILDQITLSPAMGNYLDMVNNDRASGTRVPNENYAREIMQLFSVGLDELNDDGTTINDAMGMPVPTYDQNTIKEFAKVFTGYTYADPANPAAPATKKNAPFYAANMVTYPTTATSGHETSAKTLLNGVVVPAGQTPQQDLDSAVQNVFMHPSTPAYISRQLIQRLVTGNPSAAYIARISAVFKNNGSGVRGDLKAVVKAILMDSEARGAANPDPTFGTLREPVLAITAAVRALNGITDGGRLAAQASNLGQNPYFSPTVFNYFPPDATIPGTTTLAPEFAIHTTNSAVARANLFYTMVYNGFAPDATIPNSTGTRLDLSQFAALATNPTAMVARYSEVLTGGQLDPAAQAIVVTAVTAVPVSATPTAAQLLARAQMGAYLILSSYHFQVQR
ncbi:MAG TPA: DUF1800 family protein [Casimicrobiaceae bacterium]|nr:DUF1800 family protein [Casimicrobiaceae bacterium]